MSLRKLLLFSLFISSLLCLNALAKDDNNLESKTSKYLRYTKATVTGLSSIGIGALTTMLAIDHRHIQYDQLDAIGTIFFFPAGYYVSYRLARQSLKYLGFLNKHKTKRQ